MNALGGFLVVTGSAAALVAAANAQPSDAGRRAILFDEPNFQGSSVIIVAGATDLNRWDFANRAVSGRFEGEWAVCDGPNLDGRCTTVKGDVADLARTGAPPIVSLGQAVPGDARADGDDDRSDSAADDDGPVDRWVDVAAEDQQTSPARTDRPAAAEPAIAAAKFSSAKLVAADAGAVAIPASSAAKDDQADQGGDPPADSPAPGSSDAAAPAAPDQVAAGNDPPHAAPQQLAVADPPAAASSTNAAAPAAQGEAGHSTVFFATPTRSGTAVAVDLQGPANQFCHDQGLGPAVYFATDGQSLRDVLCRR